jgi:hypothetical protein
MDAIAVGLIACAALPLTAPRAYGEKLEATLVETYRNNPSLDVQRASVRATENVPQALSRLSAEGQRHHQRRREVAVDDDPFGRPQSRRTLTPAPARWCPQFISSLRLFALPNRYRSGV